MEELKEDIIEKIGNLKEEVQAGKGAGTVMDNYHLSVFFKVIRIGKGPLFIYGVPLRNVAV